jgi:hypothetical protein
MITTRRFQTLAALSTGQPLGEIMKNILAVLALLVPTVAAAAGTPVEPKATFSGGVEKVRGGVLLQELAIYVKTSGHSCKSISGARPMPAKRGFVLICNGFSKTYDVEDRGGNWQVTVSKKSG